MTPGPILTLATMLLLVVGQSASAAEPAEPPARTQAAEAGVNQWSQVAVDGPGPRKSPALVWSAKSKRFVMIGGTISHEPKPPFPYDVLSFNAASGEWENELPPGGEAWGPRVGPVEPPKFKGPYFEIIDSAGNVRPWQRQAKMWNMGRLAPWNGTVYTLMCGRTLAYDVDRREWKNLSPKTSPAPETKTEKEGLSWGALCPDPVNEELVLFGGCGTPTRRADPGTWVYSTRDNTWRDLQPKTQPSQRALSPMVYDPVTKKIVLFGGDGLDTLHADTWVYDCATRVWEERRPAISPSPRFGHALLHLPRSGKIVLLGGIGYTSSTDYVGQLYRPLPFEIWTYDVATNEWSLIQRYADPPKRVEDRTAAHGPSHFSVDAAVAAAGEAVEDDNAQQSEADRVLWWGPGRHGAAHDKSSKTWSITLEVSRVDKAGTVTHGVKPGTVERRTGSYDPAWYTADVPAADPAEQERFYSSIEPNRWTAVTAPKWPMNRQGGGWSTVAYDTDREQILHLGGGHSSYFGNDVAMFDTRSGRWGISERPQFALDHNYDLTGPGPWAFNNGPWGNHNYQAYTYDTQRKRLVYIRGANTHFFDAARSAWRHDELLTDNAFNGSKYTCTLVSTPQGAVLWAFRAGSQSTSGLWRLTAQGWSEIKTSGEALPVIVNDGATLTFDSKRNRVLLTTTRGEKDEEHSGQVWACDLKSGAVTKLDPAGRQAIVVRRFARESVYLPKHDQVMFGYHLHQVNQIPFYDVAGNRWLVADLPDSKFFTHQQEGVSVDLGLHYDEPRDLVWAVMCKLHPGALQVLRVDEKLKRTPLKPLEE